MSTKAKNEAFKKGDRVKARWSGSNIFYDAKVVSVASRSYKVQFDDGSISSVKTSDVQKIEKSDTPPKTSKSRSRSRSTGRMTRSRSRSPARRNKAAATKKEKKASSSEISTKSEGTSNSNSITKDEVDSVPTRSYLKREKVSSSKIETKETTTASVSSRNSLTKDLKVILRRSEGSSENKRSARLAALRSEDPLNSQRILESKIAERRNAKEAEKAKYSDDEDDEEEDEEEDEIPAKTTSSIRRVLNFIAVFLKMIIIPVALLFLVFSCTKRQCTIMDFPPFYSRVRDLLNAVKFPMAGIFAFHIVQLILSLIPLGKKVTGFSSEPNKGILEYRLNGILSLFLTILVFGVSAYFGVYMNWAYDKFRGIALGAAIYSTLWGVILFFYTGFKEGFANQKASYIDQFYNGCYSNPVFNKLDLKTSLIRTGFIGAVVLNLSILLKYFLMKGYVSIPLAMTSGMQLFFILDFIVREEKLLSTATYTSDTVGYSFVMTTCFMIPIGLSFQNIYLFLLDSKTHHTPYYCSGAMLCLFLVGYYIYLTSSNLKHNFRKNPFAPEFAEVTSIPTSKKKRLVSSGWWGRIRHPNYFGLFIMATAWTLPCGFTHAVPYGPLLILAIALIVRIFRVEAECKEKYGPAWTNYTEKVRSRILPYIF